MCEERATPLHQQVRDALRNKIKQEYRVDERIPTEMELMRHFGVSRTTMRRALLDLVDEGFLYRVRGRGTFVSGTKPSKVNSSRAIGFVGPPLSDNYASELLIGIQGIAKDRGFEVIYRCSNNDSAVESMDLVELSSGIVSGLIVFPADGSKPEPFYPLLEEAFPLVLVDKYLPTVATDLVASDNFGGSKQLTEHLIEQGYTRIGCVSASSLCISSNQDRHAGYLLAMTRAGLCHIPPPMVFQDCLDRGVSWDECLSVHFVDYLYEYEPDALVVLNDYTAIALMDKVTEMGIDIPESLGIVGFDDVVAARHLPVPLTTAAQRRRELGVTAARLLVDRITGRSETAQSRLTLPVDIKIRKSSIRKGVRAKTG